MLLLSGTLLNVNAQFAISADPMSGKPMVGESYLDVKGITLPFRRLEDRERGYGGWKYLSKCTANV